MVYGLCCLILLFFVMFKQYIMMIMVCGGGTWLFYRNMEVNWQEEVQCQDFVSYYINFYFFI